MNTSTRLQCQIPTPLYNRLLAEAKRDSVTITQVLIDLIRKNIKPESQETTTARPAAQPRRAMTHSERLFGMSAPDDNGFPSEEEMEQRRKAVLDALE
jgi:hypothetical protein